MWIDKIKGKDKINECWWRVGLSEIKEKSQAKVMLNNHDDDTIWACNNVPHILQEASLLDGVDAGVCGNGRRFSKTSSYPPCHHYAFHFFYPYLLTMSLSPLFMLIHLFSQPTLPLIHLTNHPHVPYCFCSLLFPLTLLDLGTFPICGRTT